MIGACAEGTQVHVDYLVAELVGYPGNCLKVEGSEWGWVEGAVDFDIGAAFYCQFPYLVTGEQVKRVKTQPYIAHRVDHL